MKKYIILSFCISFLSLACKKEITDQCIDPKMANSEVICPGVYDPVCGCDGKTYSNSCIATHGHGVKSYTSGECGYCQPLYVSHEDSLNIYMDAVNIQKAEIRDDCLWLRVSFAGGCEAHDFRLKFIPFFCGTPPLPPVQLILEHDANGDACEALIHKEMMFDLNELKYYGVDKVEIVLSEKSQKFQKNFTYTY